MPENMDSMASPTSYLRGQIEPEADGGIKAPKNIIPNVQAARAIYYNYRTEHLKRIDLYARIEGLIAGNPPYNPVELAKDGLSHIANFNNLDGRSLYERGALAYWNLLNAAQTLCKFELRIQDPVAVKWCEILARNWDFVIRKWPSFYTLVNTLTGQLVKFGVSPVFWPDERDWRWKTIELQRFFIQDQAQSDIEQLTAVCIESIFTAQYLFEVYNRIEDGSIKDNDPWNKKELANLLLWRANSYAKTSTDITDVMELQRRLQNGDIGYDQIFSDGIRLVSLFYQEYDGKISHYMFDRWYDTGEFLFKIDRQYKSMQEALVIFTASPGEFTIHSNRGLGHKIFSGVQAMMQLDCSIIDMARLSSTPFIKSLATGASDVAPIRFYPGVPTNIGTAEFVQNNFGANIQGLVNASQYILQKLNYNTANSGDDPGIPDKHQGSISNTEAKMKSYKEFGVLKNNIAHFYSQFDLIVQNVVLKMLHSKDGYPGNEYAAEWKKLCIEEGVPEEIFDTKDESKLGLPVQFKNVRATRVAGDGSSLALIMGLQELSLISGDFGPREALEYKRQWIIATMGPEYVPAFLQESDDVDETAGGASLAGVENIAMKQGESPVFSPDNEHRSHIVIHLALGNDTIQRIQQQQITPVDADKVFTVLVPHMEDHMNFIAKSPFAVSFIEKVKKPFEQVSEYARLNRKNAASMLQAEIKKQQEQQMEQNRVLSEEELKNLQVTNEERRKDIKVESQVERAKEASETRAGIMREKVLRDSDNERLKIRLESDNKKLENKALPELRQDLANINGVTPAPADIE